MVWRDLWVPGGDPKKACRTQPLARWAQGCPLRRLVRVGRGRTGTYINHSVGSLQGDLGHHLPIAVLGLVLVTVGVRVVPFAGRAAGQGIAAGHAFLQLHNPPVTPVTQPRDIPRCLKAPGAGKTPSVPGSGGWMRLGAVGGVMG